MNRILLLDGDLFAYRHACAAEKAIDWGDGQWTLHADEGLASENLKLDIEGVQSRLQADRVVVCLSDDNHRFRDAFGSVYKEKRKDIRKPMVLAGLRQFLRDTFEAKDKPGLEADDVMGIISTNPKLYPGTEKIIVSVDKDMRTIPGLLYDGNELKTITRVDADIWHLKQTLMGDKADGFPGCPGVGTVKADRILQDAIDRNAHLSGDVSTCCWPAVIAAFLKAGKDVAYALTMARLARILRHEDWNYKTQEPILWTPQETS